MGNEIEIYQGNTKTITCTVTGLDDLVGYTATLTVKKDARDVTELIEVVGSIDTLTRIANFNISAIENTLPAADYVYEINIAIDSKPYTIVQGTYKIRESVKY